MTLIAVVYYSMYGHVAKMAEAIAAGIKQIDGVEVQLYQAMETIPPAVLQQANAPTKLDHPIVTPEVLGASHGVLFGLPTRFGMVPSQMKTLFDSCGSLWVRGDLIGKTAGFFFSTASLGGGQETTAMSTVPFLAHLGMVFVPLGYRSQSLFSLDHPHGGSPWGAGTLAGTDNSREPSEMELEVAREQGRSFAEITKKLHP